MEQRKKNRILFIYYIGIMMGALLINCLIRKYGNFTLELFDSVRNMDKLPYIERKELLGYLFVRRWKQTIFFLLIYYYFSHRLVIGILRFFMSLLAGSVLSFFLYYAGFSGMLYIMILITPLFLCGIIMCVMLEKIEEIADKKDNSTLKKEILAVFTLTTVEALVEVLLYFFLQKLGIFNNL